MARVTVADDVLSAQPRAARELDVDRLLEHDVREWVIDHWLGDVRFLVSPESLASHSAADVSASTEARLAAVAAGVRAAAERFWLVDESGREHPDRSATRLADLHTPDPVVGPLRSGSGIVVATGTKDGVTVPMGEALVRILREELERLDVDVQVACLPEDVELDDLEPYHAEPVDPPAPTETQHEHSFWYVARPVLRTARGRAFDREFLRPDSTWSSDQAEAVSFAKEDLAVMVRLVEKLRATRANDQGEVTGLLLPATSKQPHPVSPEDIRGDQ